MVLRVIKLPKIPPNRRRSRKRFYSQPADTAPQIPFGNIGKLTFILLVHRGILQVVRGIADPPPLMESTMKTRILLPVLALSAVFVSPASANWFSNPDVNINLNLGSAPNPTPGDIRSDRQPMLVRDAEGNVIAMIDPTTGKMIAIAEPSAAAQPKSGAAKVAPPAVRAH